MRPVGEVRQALLSAAAALLPQLPEGRSGPTLRELAAHACVGYDAAMATVKNMTRCGDLEITGERKVPYRNRPVAEYQPGAVQVAAVEQGFVDLGQLLDIWNRR